MIFLQIIACILIADLLVGIVHWAEDTYCWPKLPVFGSWLCVENILHHEKPSNMVNTSASFWHRNYQPMLAALFVGGVLSLICYLVLGYVHWMLPLTAFIGCWGNEVHYWTHSKNNNRLVVLLQDMGLVLTKSQHNKHHRSPYLVCYCTMTNWLNPILDLVKFWRGLEWIISRFGIHPKRGTELRRGF